MGIRAKSLTQILKSIDLDALPVGVGLHHRDLDQVGIQKLAKEIAENEGKFVRIKSNLLDTGALRRSNPDRMFQIGKKGLFVYQNEGTGKKELRIGVLRNPNWALGMEQEGFVLSEGNFAKQSKGFKIPIPFRKSRQVFNEGTFSPRGPYTYPVSSSLRIDSFKIDAKLKGEFEFQNRLLDYRKNVVPFKVEIPEGLKYENVKHSLFGIWNGLLDEKLLKHDYEQRYYSRGAEQQGLSRLGEILGKRHEPNLKDLMSFERNFNPKVEDIIKKVYEHMIGSFAISQFKDTLYNRTHRTSSFRPGTHGFNGEIAIIIVGHQYLPEEGPFQSSNGFYELNVNPNDNGEVWVKPHGTKFRDLLLEMYKEQNSF